MARTVTRSRPSRSPRKVGGNGAKSRERAVEAPERPAPSRAPGADKLYPTKNDLPAASRVEAIALLNQRLAGASDGQAPCKQAHRNVNGAAFVPPHTRF